jgi:hypothetical protein
LALENYEINIIIAEKDFFNIDYRI